MTDWGCARGNEGSSLGLAYWAQGGVDVSRSRKSPPPQLVGAWTTAFFFFQFREGGLRGGNETVWEGGEVLGRESWVGEGGLQGMLEWRDVCWHGNWIGCLPTQDCLCKCVGGA